MLELSLREAPDLTFTLTLRYVWHNKRYRYMQINEKALLEMCSIAFCHAGFNSCHAGPVYIRVIRNMATDASASGRRWAVIMVFHVQCDIFPWNVLEFFRILSWYYQKETTPQNDICFSVIINSMLRVNMVFLHVLLHDHSIRRSRNMHI